MKKRFALETTVPVQKSKNEIELLVVSYGAKSFMAGSNSDHPVVAFEMEDRKILMRLPIPSIDCDEVRKFNAGGGRVSRRTDAQAQGHLDKIMRSSWRALLLSIKAKLEAASIGISTFEDEFMAHIVMPDGSTIGENIRPRIASAYRDGKMPPLLAGPTKD